MLTALNKSSVAAYSTDAPAPARYVSLHRSFHHPPRLLGQIAVAAYWASALPRSLPGHQIDHTPSLTLHAKLRNRIQIP
jgi:hypothetical protein